MRLSLRGSTQLLTPAREKTRVRQSLIFGLWILVLAVAMIGWLVALAWIAYQLIRHLVF